MYGSADSGEVPAVVEQRVHQRSARMPGRGVHHHADGLVHHDHVLVLEENGERDRLRRELAGDRLGRPGLESVARAHPLAGARGCGVDEHASLVDPAPHL